MIEPANTLSVRRQCELLNVSRSGLYYEPVPTSTDELELMRLIDELHLKWPHLGSRKLAKESPSKTTPPRVAAATLRRGAIAFVLSNPQ